MTKRRCLLNTLHGERGELYFRKGGRRVRLTSCTPAIEIWREETSAPCIGGETLITRLFFSVIICDDAVFTRDVNAEFLQSVDGFDLNVELQRADGNYKLAKITDLPLHEYDATENKLTFVTNAYQSANVKHLLEELT
ncbi:MAG: hypothetical protein K6G71_00870 [Clostridiales bacterium]|nr:hypothetical protein [Clostridiales bacterium]